MDLTHYIIGIARTQMTKINHRGDAWVNYSSALPNGTISSGRQQKLLLAWGSNMREWCLGEERQWGDCHFQRIGKYWLCGVWQGREVWRLAEDFQEKRSISAQVFERCICLVYTPCHKSNGGNPTKWVKIPNFHLESFCPCSWQEQVFSFLASSFS